MRGSLWSRSPESDHAANLVSSDGRFTRSLISTPGLKWGTYFAGTITFSPVLGLRPTLGGRSCTLKLPNPRISTRPPVASFSVMASKIAITESFASCCVNWGKRLASLEIRLDLVMRKILSHRHDLPTQPRA